MKKERRGEAVAEHKEKKIDKEKKQKRTNQLWTSQEDTRKENDTTREEKEGKARVRTTTTTR